MADKLREAGSLTRSLRAAIAEGQAGLKHIPGLLLRIINDDLWQDRIDLLSGQPVHFDRFVDYVTTAPIEGLGEDLASLRRLCADNPEALDALDRVTVERPGGDRQSAEYQSKNDNVMNDTEQGNSTAYALRRLRKDAPELHTRVLAGELSPHGAMVQAGFRKKSINLPLDPAAIARRLAGSLDAGQLQQLIAALAQYLLASDE